MKIEVVERRSISIPAIKFDRPTMTKIGKAVEVSILSNIRDQKQADGSTLKSNAPSTKEKKRKLGRRLLSLVDAPRPEGHRFVRGRGGSWKSTVKGGLVTVKPATQELRKISANVQRLGYTGWFGVNDQGVRVIRTIVRGAINKAFDSAARRL